MGDGGTGQVCYPGTTVGEKEVRQTTFFLKKLDIEGSGQGRERGYLLSVGGVRHVEFLLGS